MFAALLSSMAAVAPAITTEISGIYETSNPYHTPPRAGVDPKFDCAWRQQAYVYGLSLQPAMTKNHQSKLADALELRACPGGAPVPKSNVTEADRRRFTIPENSTAIMVQPAVDGIHAALVKARDTVGHVTLALLPGVHRITKPILLSPADSHTTIQSFGDGEVVLTGSKSLTGVPSWEPYQVAPPSPPVRSPVPLSPAALLGFAPATVPDVNLSLTGNADYDAFHFFYGRQVWTSLPGMNAVYAATPGAPGSAVWISGTEPSAAACQASCEKTSGCNVYTWHAPSVPGYANQCWMRSDGVWNLVSEAGHTAGRAVRNSSNIWKTRIPESAGVTSIVGLRLNSGRGQRARYPNANSELDQFPKGWVGGNNDDGISWGKVMHGPDPDRNIEVASPNRSFCMNEFQLYEEGQGGCCAGFTPAEGYWCSSKTSGGGAFTYRIPSGITLGNRSAVKILPNTPYADAKGAVFQAWRPGHWASWMFEVDSFANNPNGSTTFGWTKGGFQGARGSDKGAEFFVENVFEELDDENEFFYDRKTSTLYLYYNATAGTPPPASLEIEATDLQDYIQVLGTPPTRGGEREAVTDVTIRGITIRDAGATYLEPHGMPSGGDWGLQRRGAVYLEGTERITIEACLFTRNDGNSVMLSGYNRGVLIKDVEAVWNGDSVLASWGIADGIDGTSGEQPRGTVVDGLFCHEIGQYEKQSSCWFQAKTAQTEIKNSIMFNMPRAAINFNDGFGGGNAIHDDLIFNSCRERFGFTCVVGPSAQNSDHGPFNSWDRQPYLTEVGNGSASLVPAYNTITRTFMVANYGANGGCIDNDDGSSWYNITNNFFVFGGHKSDFQGHNKLSYGNVNAYPGVYGPRCLMLQSLPNVGPNHAWDEAYSGNKCILATTDETYLQVGGSCNPAASDQFTLILGHNELWSPAAKATVHICGKSYEFAEWLATGLDNGTTIADSSTITASDIVRMGMAAINK